MFKSWTQLRWRSMAYLPVRIISRFSILGQFSCSAMSDSLWLHGWRHSRLPCPSPTPGACSNSCPLSRWCHPTISYSVVPFSSCLQTFPASGSFPVSQFLASGSQNIQLHHQSFQWIFRTDFLVGFSCSPRDSRESSPTPQFKSINSSALNFIVQLSHPYMTTGKTIALTRWTFVGKAMSLLFNVLSRLVRAFLLSFKKEQASFNFMAAVTIGTDFGIPKNKASDYFHCFPIRLPWVMRLDAMIFAFWMLSFTSFFTLLFNFHQEAL